MTDALTPPKIYQSWSTDSRRWKQYQPRAGDIVIGTYPKCGTTWMQRIVDLLVFQSAEARPIVAVSPWIDMRFRDPIEQVLERLEQQQHRRFMKSHLPFDGLPLYDEVRYIHVARDGRDACMSYFNHCSGYTEIAYQGFDRASADMGGPAPRCPSDVRTFWKNWLTKGIQPGVEDGFPTLSFFDLENTYWAERQRANLLLVHYADLKADLAAEMRRIAEFLGIESRSEIWPDLVQAASFAGMKSQGPQLLPAADVVFDGGTERFLYKGTNGRWRDEIPLEDLAIYEEKVKRRFTPGLARWIEGGRQAAGDPRTSAA